MDKESDLAQQVAALRAEVNKLAENGSFRSTRTSFCGLTQMVPIDLILDAFDRLKVTMEGRDPSDALSAMRDGFAGSMPNSCSMGNG